VLVEETHPAEGFLAARAGILLGLEVGLKVSAEVGLVGEAPGAVDAGKRFFTGVDSKVALEQPGPGEALSADVTLARQRVGPDVHLQCRQRRVALVAELAGKVLLDLVGRVHLLVLDVTGLGGEPLLALRAEVGLLGRLGRPGVDVLFLDRHLQVF